MPRILSVYLILCGGFLAGIIAPIVGIFWSNAESSVLGAVAAVAINLLGIAVILLASTLRRASEKKP